jgi:DNA-binding NtrC family response regulator
VYIPEVSTLSEMLQLKLLQFLQYKTISRVGQDPRKPERQLDVRVIMASNERLENVVKSGRMREDFYHRITGVKLNVPPLRERAEDIEPLAQYFLRKFVGGFEGFEYTFAPEVLEAFRHYRWPGNVRELENVIKNAIAYATGGQLTLADFPILHESRAEEGPTDAEPCRICMGTRFASLPSYEAVESSFKRAYIEEALQRTGGNVTKAAAIAGLTPQGFRKIMNALAIRKG